MAPVLFPWGSMHQTGALCVLHSRRTVAAQNRPSPSVFENPTNRKDPQKRQRPTIYIT